MIDEDIKIIINDILFHTREMLKFLITIKTENYNAYLDDLIDYALCTEEDIQTIEHSTNHLTSIINRIFANIKINAH